MSRFLGIDLGTTNSTVSVANTTSRGDVEAQTLDVLQVDETGNNLAFDRALPSVLYIDEHDQPFVGKFAKRMATVYPKRVVREAKRFIGAEKSWDFNDKKIRPEEVSAAVLKPLKVQAEQYYGGEKIDSVVITVPANFNFQQENATRLAAELAGFDKTKVHTLPEPTAALIDFLNTEQNTAPEARRINFKDGKKNLLVFDLGGGTCDVSILQVHETNDGGMEIQELSISQYTELGGIDFDKKVANHFMKFILKELNMSYPAFEKKYLQHIPKLWGNLQDIAEKAKQSFSSRILSTLQNQGIDYYENKEKFDSMSFKFMLSDLPPELMMTLSISKKEYDEIVSDLLYKEKAKNDKSIEVPILTALATAKVGEMKKEDIDAVFLVGGMTFYQTIQDRIYEIFDKRIKPIQSVNPMFAVSRGAAIFHHSLDKIVTKRSDSLLPPTAGPKGGVVIGKTVPNNIYIEVVGGDPVPLLEKGTKLPYDRIIEDKFYVNASGTESINAMELKLFTALSPKASNPKWLKSAVIPFSKPVQKHSPLVLKVYCNEEREVSIKAWLKDDESEVIDVKIGSHEYTEEQKEAITNRLERINKIDK